MPLPALAQAAGVQPASIFYPRCRNDQGFARTLFTRCSHCVKRIRTLAQGSAFACYRQAVTGGVGGAGSNRVIRGIILPRKPVSVRVIVSTLRGMRRAFTLVEVLVVIGIIGVL